MYISAQASAHALTGVASPRASPPLILAALNRMDTVPSYLRVLLPIILTRAHAHVEALEERGTWSIFSDTVTQSDIYHDAGTPLLQYVAAHYYWYYLYLFAGSDHSSFPSW